MLKYGVESISNQESCKQEQEKYSRLLLSGISDLQDSLVLKIEENADIPPGEKTAFVYANQSLISFVESSELSFSTANPRSIRDRDRKSILPGQHGGVFVQFGLQDGTILRINFFGGLRTVSVSDLKDGDTSLRNSHTRRTDEVLTQATHLNWQINYPNGPVIDSWMIYHPNDRVFQQSSLKIDGKYVDCHPGIGKKDKVFEPIHKEIFQPIGELIKLIPSSV